MVRLPLRPIFLWASLFCVAGCLEEEKVCDKNTSASEAEADAECPASETPPEEVVNNEPDYTFVEQPIIYDRPGDYAFAHRLTSGDFDGDGYVDIAALLIRSVRIYSGRTSKVIFSHDATALGTIYNYGQGDGGFANIGDFNGDGSDDLVVSDYELNRFFVFSPKTSNSPIATFRKIDQELFDATGREGRSFGSSIASGHDVNGDGVKDFVVGAPYFGPSGKVYVISGNGGGVLNEFEVVNACNADGCPGHLGISVAFGHFDHVAGIDIAAGSSCYLSTAGWCAGAVFSFSLTNNTQIQYVGGQRFFEKLGGSMRNIGDTNSDGLDDLIVSAGRGSGGGSSGWDYGRVYRVTWAAGPLTTYSESDRCLEGYGFAVLPMGDFNGDGVNDILISRPGYHLGNRDHIGGIKVLSGADLSLIYNEEGTFAEQSFGIGLTALGDINGDGKADIAASSPWGGSLPPSGQKAHIKIIFGR